MHVWEGQVSAKGGYSVGETHAGRFLAGPGRKQDSGCGDQLTPKLRLIWFHVKFGIGKTS